MNKEVCTADGGIYISGLCPGSSQIQCCLDETAPECTANGMYPGECSTIEQCNSLAGRTPLTPTSESGCAVGQICCVDSPACSSGNSAIGKCVHTTTCDNQLIVKDGEELCPGTSSIQCCIDLPTCDVEGTVGQCQDKDTCSEPGSYILTGECPGDSEVKCCVILPSCKVDVVEGDCMPAEECSGLPALSWHGCPGRESHGVACCLPEDSLVCYTETEAGKCGRSCDRPAEGPDYCPDGLSCCLPECVGGEYNQLGDDIDGEAASDKFGQSVSLSSSGRIVAIGAPWNKDIGRFVGGHVRVLGWNHSSNAWIQRGGDIDGSERNFFGSTVSLSGDGSILAAGATGVPGLGVKGYVSVYKWNQCAKEQWDRLGNILVGKTEYEEVVDSVSLSRVGTVLAVGTIGAGVPSGPSSEQPPVTSSTYVPGNEQTESTAPSQIYYGLVRVYEWVPSSWVQRGPDFYYGEAAFGSTDGSSLSLSHDGNILAIGNGKQNGAAGEESGRVSVYMWDESSREWNQRGNDIEGEFEYAGFGVSMSLSYDGSFLAVGAHASANFPFQVRVFEWNVNKTIWADKGSAIEIDDGTRRSIYRSLSLSSDGSILAVGVDDLKEVTWPRELVKVFKWNGTMWVQRGSRLTGAAPQEEFGYTVSLSDDGNMLAAGAYAGDGENGTSSGYVRVYNYTTCSLV